MPRRPVPCGPLDILNERASLPTGRVPAHEIHAALDAAVRSPAYDGPALTGTPDGPVALGPRTVAKAQHRRHELLGTAEWFSRLGHVTGIPVPELLDRGTTSTAAGGRWWLVLGRIRGVPSARPTTAQQEELGTVFRAWHEQAPLEGLALDDPGAIGVLLGSARTFHPEAYPAVAELLADECRGLTMTSIHGDAAVGHNTLYGQHGRLAAVLDPGAVHIGPPMFDLAWALAVDLPRGAMAGPLLDAYGRDAADVDTLDALLPYFLLRRMLDCHLLGEQEDARWLRNELARRAPNLLGLRGVPPESGP